VFPNPAPFFRPSLIFLLHFDPLYFAFDLRYIDCEGRISVSRLDRLIETLLGAVGEVEIGGVGDLTADRTAIFFRGGGSGIFSARRPYLLSAA
jgi:hypothetical protein